MAELRSAHDAEVVRLGDEIDELRDSLTELQERFDARESRPEDVKRMQQMEAGMRQREAAVQKAMDDMHYYKLELQNREENYNQLFGSKAVQKAGGGRGARAENALSEPPGMNSGGLGGPLGANLRVGVINPLAQKTNTDAAARPPLNGGRKGGHANGNLVNGGGGPNGDGRLGTSGGGGPLPKLPGPPGAAWGANPPASELPPPRRGSSNLSSLPPGVPGSPSLGRDGSSGGLHANGHTKQNAKLSTAFASAYDIVCDLCMRYS